MSKKNIVVFSSGPIGALFLEEILRYKSFKVHLVVICNNNNNPFYKEGKHDPVEKVCSINSVNMTFDPNSVVGKKYDLGLSFSNFHILKNEQISSFEHGVINFHGAPVEWYKGSAVPAYHILHGDEPVWGYTYHYVDEGLDTGNIIKQILYDIPKGLTSEEIDKSVVVNALEGVHDFFDYILLKKLNPKTILNQNTVGAIKRKDLEKLAILNENLPGNIDFEKIMRAFNWPKILKHPKVVVNDKNYRIVPEEKYDEMLKAYREFG
jgi:methionyl-tRNA formyltransferase